MLQKIADDLKAYYREHYGFSIFDVQIQEIESHLILKGQVLLKKQHKTLLDKIKKINSLTLVDEIIVLEDKQISDFLQASEHIDIYDIPVERLKKQPQLMTQANQGEWLKMLYQSAEDFLLVQCADTAIGWIKNNNYQIQKDQHQKKYWQHLKPLQNNTLKKTVLSSKSITTLAESYLGTPYLLGGKTEEAFDCSAFTQLIFEKTCNLLLPRHSWDQKKYGKKINTSLKVGDCLYALGKKGRDIKHVGLLLDPQHIIHASRRQKEVVIWTKDLFKKIYEIKSINRFVEIN